MKSSLKLFFTLFASLISFNVIHSDISIPVTATSFTPEGVMEKEGTDFVITDKQPIRHDYRYERNFAMPKFIAIPTTQGIKVFEFDKADFSSQSEPWVLIWFDDQFKTTKLIYQGDLMKVSSEHRGQTGDWYNRSSDKPILITMTQKLNKISADNSGVHLKFNEKARAWSLPLFGKKFLNKGVTKKWTTTLPDDIAELCRIWPAYLLNPPVQVIETAELNGNDLTLTHSFQHKAHETDFPDWKPIKAQPVSPLFSLMKEWTSVDFSLSGGKVVETNYISQMGPFQLMLGDSVTIKIPGILHHVRQDKAFESKNSNKKLLQKLHKELDAVLAIDEPLAPVRVFFGEDVGYAYLLSNPADYYLPLFAIHQAMDDEGKQKVVQMVEQFEKHRPLFKSFDEYHKDSGYIREFEPNARKELKYERYSTEPVTYGNMLNAAYHRHLIIPDKDYLEANATETVKQMAKQRLNWNFQVDPMPRWQSRWPALKKLHHRPLAQIQSWISAAKIAGILGLKNEQQVLETQAAKGLFTSLLYPAILGAWASVSEGDLDKPNEDNVSHETFFMYFSEHRGVHAGRINTWGRHYYQGLTGISSEVANYWKQADKTLLIQPAIDDLFEYARDWYVTDGSPNFHITEKSRMPAEWRLYAFQDPCVFLRRPDGKAETLGGCSLLSGWRLLLHAQAGFGDIATLMIANG